MADTPITREEKYLAYLTGDYKADVPKPITRQERYLYELCLKGMGGEISPEEIQKAVNDYLDKNPVKPGATTEQAQQIEQNKKDIGSLKESMTTKITKFYASNQGNTNLPDSDNGKIMDMVLYGRSEQKQYSGKNLLNATLRTTTQNGVTCTNNGDGTYTLNGTASATTSFQVVQEGTNIPNGTYKVTGCPSGGSSEKYYIRCGSELVDAWNDNGDGCTAIISNTKMIYRIVIVAGVTVNNLLFKPMLTTDLTATYDDFEPYTGGIPSPNPDYPQEIKSVVNPTVKVCGKNLFKATLGNVTANGITCTANSDGTYILNGTCTVSTALSIIGIFDHILNEPLYLTGVPSGCGSYLSLGRRDGDNILVTDGKNTKIDAGIHTDHIEFWITKGTTLNNVIFKPMLTTDSTATYDDFEPYREQTVTLPYDLYGVKVPSGGNVTIDGQEYASDYFDVERGKLVRMVVEVDLGTLSYDYIKSEKRFRAKVNNAYTKDPVYKHIICKNYIAASANDTFLHKYKYAISINDNYIYISNDDYTTPENFKTANSGVKAYYILSTPEEIDLTPEEIAAFKALATYYPTTNISINSEQLDGYTVFNYPISMQNGWNYVKQQIGDTRDYIYDMDARTQDTDLQAAEAYVNSEYAVALTELEV